MPVPTARRSLSDSLTFKPSPSGIRFVPVNVSLYLSVSQQIFIEPKAASYKVLGLGLGLWGVDRGPLNFPAHSPPHTHTYFGTTNIEFGRLVRVDFIQF